MKISEDTMKTVFWDASQFFADNLQCFFERNLACVDYEFYDYIIAEK